MQNKNIIPAFLKYLPSFKLSVFVVCGLIWGCLLFRWHYIKRRTFARDKITNAGYTNPGSRYQRKTGISGHRFEKHGERKLNCKNLAENKF